MPPDNDALGLYRYVGSLTHPVRYHSKTIFYTPTVGADRIRLWHKAPLRGACVLGRLIVDPYSGLYHSSGCFLKSEVSGGCYPPLQLEQEVGWHLKMTGYFENTTYRKEHTHETF